MASITCTHCNAVLKTKDPIPPGKKVKCPKCAQAFVVQAEEAPADVDEPEEKEEAAEGAGEEEAKPKKGKAAASDDDAEAGDGDGDEGTAKKGQGGDKKSNKTIIYIIVAAVVLFCCCPSICGTVYSIFAGAINAALGIGAAAQQQKMLEELQKAKMNMNMDKKN